MLGLIKVLHPLTLFLVSLWLYFLAIYSIFTELVFDTIIHLASKLAPGIIYCQVSVVLIYTDIVFAELNLMSLSSALTPTYTNMHQRHLFARLILLLDESREGDRKGRGRRHAADAICPPLCVCACVCVVH